MILDAYVAVMAALMATGVLLIVVGLRGTTAPARSRARQAGRLRRWWLGTARTPAERRRRNLLLAGAAAIARGHAIDV